MKRDICGLADSFASAGLLCLLPEVGSINKLEELTTSLFARSEKVSNMLEEISGQDELARRSLAEQAMLLAVLEWLEVQTPQKSDSEEN